MNRLNPQSPIPLYRQLADRLLSEIRAGAFPPGSRIPSEHELAATYDIGRPTARQATELLVRNGVLARKRGSGTYVRSDPKEVDLFSFAGTLSAFQKKGIPVDVRILQKTGLTRAPKDPENPFSHRRAYFFSRLSRVASEPVLIEDMYLDPVLFSGIDRVDLTGRSLSQVVDEQYYMRPVGGRQTFRIGYVEGKRAELLEISTETPILLVKRYLDFEQGESAVYSELFCRTDRFIFSQVLGGHQ